MKAAVCLYDGFCNFEFSVLLESLALADCQIDYIAKTLKPVRAEEGFLALEIGRASCRERVSDVV